MRMCALFVAVLLLVAGLMPHKTLAADPGGNNWTTRGGSVERRQQANESFGLIAGVAAWNTPVDVGVSGSQPLFVEDKIYHLAGTALWEITPDGTKTALMEQLNMVKNANGTWEMRPSTSGITYATVNGASLLYFGTGDNQVCAYHLDTGTGHCWSLTARTTAEEPIVTVPLVLKASQNGKEVDIVIMGDKRGNLWALQNLAGATTPSDVLWERLPVGGWILASPVPLTDGSDLTFVWASDRGDKGTVGTYRVVPGGDGQDLHFDVVVPDYTPPSGVADGFAKDQNFIYATDKRGNFLKMMPRQRRYEVLKYSDSAGPLFANAAPAVDEKHVYFSIRNVGTTQPNQESYPGRLVAVDKESFTVAWTADLKSPANTNPLVWTAGPNVVLVGDTKGTLYAFDRMTGKPADFMLDAAPLAGGAFNMCEPISERNLGTVHSAGAAYQNITGVSEPILASGTTGQALLLAGVSGRGEPAADGTTPLVGSLMAFKAGGAYNVAWTSTDLEGGTLNPGQTYTFSGELRYEPWAAMPQTPRIFGLHVLWVPSDEAKAAGAVERSLGGIPDQVTLVPGVPLPVSIPFTPQESDGGSGRLKAVINANTVFWHNSELGQEFRDAYLRAHGASEPFIAFLDTLVVAARFGEAIQAAGGLFPGDCVGGVAELTPTPGPLADNFLRGAFTINAAADLAIKRLVVPAALACNIGTRAPFSFVIHNPSSRTFTGVPLKATIKSARTGRTWTSFPGPVRLNPGDNSFTSGLSLVSCPDTLTVELSLNLEPEPKPVAEPNYENNRALAAAEVGPVDSPVFEGGDGGDSHVIIVPPDCNTTADWASGQPCSNYPGLRIPR